MPREKPMFHRRDFLSTVSAALAIGRGLRRAEAAEQASPSLKELGERKRILLGSAVSNRRCQEPVARQQILRNCSIVTSEVEMKWNALRPTPTQFNFAGADYFVQFSEQNHLAVHGHTLLWYQALPAWFDSVVHSGNAADFMTQHILTVVQRYRSKIRYWDV